MNKRGLSFLAALFLLTIIGYPATQLQANNASKKSDEAATAIGQEPRPQKIRDEGAGQERNGEEWFNRGYELHSSDRYPEAIQAFKHSIALGYRQATAMYNIACGYALLNDKENAVVWLERPLAFGFARADLLRSDSDLDSLRTDARFRKILASNPKANEKSNGYRTPDPLEQANLDFLRLTREASQDGSEWHKVGRRLLGLRDLDRSIVALNQAAALLDYKGSAAMYNLACAYALKGERDAGLNWLEKSINAGFDNNDKVKHDPDIKSLRDDARFKRLEKLS